MTAALRAGTLADGALVDRIARLFAEGQPYQVVLQRGLAGGWTPAHVTAVLNARGWRLDSSGRVPREQRPAVVPGRPVGTTGSGLGPGVRDQLPVPRPASTPPPGPPPKASAARPPGELSAEAVLEVGARHQVATIRTKARKATKAVQDLRAALDARRACDELAATLERETEAKRQALATLDHQRATLAAEILALEHKRAAALRGITTPAAPAAPTHGATPVIPTPRPVGGVGTKQLSAADRPINHGSWGGYLAHRYRGETPEQIEAGCPACHATKTSRGRA